MVNKLQQKAQKSKLQTDINIKPKEEQLLIVSDNQKIFPLPRKIGSSVRSFRLDDRSWNDLQELLNEINKHSSIKKVNASQLFRALIYLGKVKIKEEEIIKAIKETSL